MKRAVEEGPAAGWSGWWPCRHRMVCINWSQLSCKYQKSNSMWRSIYSVTYGESGVGLTIGTSESRRSNDIIRAGLPLVSSPHCCLSVAFTHSQGGSPHMVQGDPCRPREHILLSQNPRGCSRTEGLSASYSESHWFVSCHEFTTEPTAVVN